MDSPLIHIVEFFRNSFAPINASFDWGFFFGVLGTYLGILGLISSKKQKRGFSLNQGDNTYATQIPEVISDRVSISYKGQQENNLINTVIYLQNNGNIELKNDDFNNDCVLNFSEEVEILEYSIQSSDKFTVISSYIESNKIFFKISFIEPNVHLKVDILYKCHKLPDTSFNINIVSGEKKQYDMNKYTWAEHFSGMGKDTNFALIWLGICFLILCGIAFINGKMFSVDIWNSKGDLALPIGWVALFFIGAFLPTFLIWNSVYSQLSFNRIKGWLDVKEWTTIEKKEL